MKIKLTHEQIEHVMVKEMRELLEYYSNMDTDDYDDFGYAVTISEAAAHILCHYGTPGKDFE